MKDKKLGKIIISKMNQGHLPEQVAGQMNMTIKEFKKRIKKSKHLKRCFELGKTKLIGHYQAKLADNLDNKWANDNLIKLFYFNYMGLKAEPKQDKNKGTSTADANEVLKALANKLPD